MFNIACGDSTSLNELFSILKCYAGDLGYLHPVFAGLPCSLKGTWKSNRMPSFVLGGHNISLITVVQVAKMCQHRSIVTVQKNISVRLKACTGLLRHEPHHRKQTNGVAERAVRRVREGAAVALLQAGTYAIWWPDASHRFFLISACHQGPIAYG